MRDQLLAEHPEAELYLVDTLQASVAEGLLVYEAIQQRDKGLTARELAEWASEARFFVDAEFMVEDLESLRRGGRIPGSVAYAGSKLDVKPLLTIATDGKLSLSGVARGRKKGIKQLVEYYQRRVAKKVPAAASWWPMPTARRTPTASRRCWRGWTRASCSWSATSARSSAAMWGPA